MLEPHIFGSHFVAFFISAIRVRQSSRRSVGDGLHEFLDARGGRLRLLRGHGVLLRTGAGRISPAGRPPGSQRNCNTGSCLSDHVVRHRRRTPRWSGRVDLPAARLRRSHASSRESKAPIPLVARASSWSARSWADCSSATSRSAATRTGCIARSRASWPARWARAGCRSGATGSGWAFPLVAESHVAAFYPPNLVLYRVLDVPTAYRLSMWLHYLALVATTYFYARCLGILPWGGAMAAVAFTLCGFQAIHSSHEPFYCLMPYLPLALGLAERFMATGRLGWLAALPLVLGLQWTLGHFQIQTWTGGLVILTGLWRAAFDRRPWRRAFALILAVVWGAALAAVQLGPSWQFAELVGQTRRPVSDLLFYSFPPAHWFELALPRLVRELRLGPEDPYWFGQQTTGYEAALYVGTIPLILAFVGFVARPAGRATMPWRILIPVSLAMATMPRWWPQGYLYLLAAAGAGIFPRPGAVHPADLAWELALLAGEGFDRSISTARFRLGLAAALVFGGCAAVARRVLDHAARCPSALHVRRRRRRLPLGGPRLVGRPGHRAGLAVGPIGLAGRRWSPPRSSWGSSTTRGRPSGAGRSRSPGKPGPRPSWPVKGPSAWSAASSTTCRSGRGWRRRSPTWVSRIPIRTSASCWSRSGSFRSRSRIADRPGGRGDAQAMAPALPGDAPGRPSSGGGRRRRGAGALARPGARPDRLPRGGRAGEPVVVDRPGGRPVPRGAVAARARTSPDRAALVDRLSRSDDRDIAWFLAEDRVPDRPDARSARLVVWDGTTATVEHDGPCDLVIARTFDPGWLARVDDGPERPVLPVDGGFQAVRLDGAGRPSREPALSHPPDCPLECHLDRRGEPGDRGRRGDPLWPEPPPSVWKYSIASRRIASMITGIDHVQITVPADGVEQARAFYCGLLGLREVEKPESLKGRGGFWLQAGDRQVHVGIEDGVDRRATRAHIAYAVVGIDLWRNRLAAAGVDMSGGIPIPGYDRFEFRDPFGNRVEFIQAAGMSTDPLGTGWSDRTGARRSGLPAGLLGRGCRTSTPAEDSDGQAHLVSRARTAIRGPPGHRVPLHPDRGDPAGDRRIAAELWPLRPGDRRAGGAPPDLPHSRALV